MMRPLDPVCFDAFVRLLERPDPVDLPRRRHVRRFEGDPDRRGTRLPGIVMAWLQRRHLQVDPDEPVARADRPQVASPHTPAARADLRLLRRPASQQSSRAPVPGPYAPSATVAHARGSR